MQEDESKFVRYFSLKYWEKLYLFKNSLLYFFQASVGRKVSIFIFLV